MKKLTRMLVVTVVALISLTLFSSKVRADDSSLEAIQKIQKAGVLKIGVKQDVPNFGYYSAEAGQYEGLEIDLGKKIAKQLGVKVEFTPVTAQTREALLDNGQIDILIATYTITKERQASYAISEPYYYDEIGFLVDRSKGYKTIDDLNGLTIGVAQGSTTKAAIEEYGKAHHLKFKFVQLGSYPELAISLYANRINAFSVDKSILSGYVSKKTKILSQGFNVQEYGIAATKANQGLINYINTLLSEWKADGELQKLYDKYHLTPATPSEN